jgi:hypothetical protein
MPARRLHVPVAALGLLVAACNEPAPARAPAADPRPLRPTTSAAPHGEACATRETCRTRAASAEGADKIALLARACDLGDGASCAEAADALLRRPEGATGDQVLPLLERGCKAKSARACARLGQLRHNAGSEEAAAEAFDTACDAGDGASCHQIAELVMGGFLRMDHAVLDRARARACAAGRNDDCPAAPTATAPEPTDSSPEESIAGANLTVGSVSADGVKLEKLSCKMSGLGLLGAMMVVGSVAAERAALARCGVKDAVPVTWSLGGGKVTEATARTGDAKRDACVVTALKKIRSTSDGRCAARLSLASP